MSQAVEAQILTVMIAENRYLCHNNLPGLSVDLLDLNLCVSLSVTVFLMITGFSLVSVNDYFLSLTLFYDRCSIRATSLCHRSDHADPEWNERNRHMDLGQGRIPVPYNRSAK